MLGSVGALIFGSLSDLFGRKWPFIGNLGALVVLELGTGFAQSLSQFLGVRALYGIAMGGLFGPAASAALGDLPYEARGIFWPLRARLYDRLLARCNLLPYPRPNHFSWLAQFILVRSRPTPSHHHIPPLPPRNQPLPSPKSRAGNQTRTTPLQNPQCQRSH